MKVQTEKMLSFSIGQAKIKNDITISRLIKHYYYQFGINVYFSLIF